MPAADAVDPNGVQKKSEIRQVFRSRTNGSDGDEYSANFDGRSVAAGHNQGNR
jgi:hypothetical protein